METQPATSIFTQAAFLRQLPPVLVGSGATLLLLFIFHPGHRAAPLGLLVALTILVGAAMGLILQAACWLDAFLDKWVRAMLHGAACLYSPQEKPRSLRWLIVFSLQIPSKALKIAFSQPISAQAPNIFAAEILFIAVNFGDLAIRQK
uniref:Uncharacterized protein n=1 Tax=mine drainage metagenome TaxID=410659 RepID=E6Q8X0_9ZZZZ